ncbi:MAG: phospholipid carrier-dependent glycosyltransferase [Dehalococcoidia bacterium]
MSLAWFKDKQNILALIITLLLLGLHLAVINSPDELMFDENHYVTEARSILAGEGLEHPEHPSLSKLFIALGITIFGDNAFGWRIFSVLFGVAAIMLFYLICKSLTTRRYLPLFATFIFAFDNFNFVQGGIAMLDVFSVTLMLASFLLYLRTRYMSSGIALAFSAVAKVPGAFGGGAILLHWLFTRRRPKRDAVKFLISAPLAFLALMLLVDYIATGQLLYPWDRVHYMVTTHAGLTFASTTAGNVSHPWDWIISPVPMAYCYNPWYLGCTTWTLWGLIIPSMGYAIYEAIKRNSMCIFALAWFASTYIVWIPIELITDRIMFKFYFYPSIGAVCLPLALGIYRIAAASGKIQRKKWRWTVRGLIILWMISHTGLFIFMSPFFSP